LSNWGQLARTGGLRHRGEQTKVFETSATLRSERDGPGSGDFNYRRLCLTRPAELTVRPLTQQPGIAEILITADIAFAR